MHCEAVVNRARDRIHLHPGGCPKSQSQKRELDRRCGGMTWVTVVWAARHPRTITGTRMRWPPHAVHRYFVGLLCCVKHKMSASQDGGWGLVSFGWPAKRSRAAHSPTLCACGHERQRPPAGWR
ncbi:uncharacterized protein MELLADRAFT_104415 [Melampsora larici-populina 98AG31]|uniref:Uncharacterized protein n=1 Tax=Melampsora larici-populina (strain 98AG31 / pathotype 3-4-7) TaxID=747676 RepID=F4REL6_MELLP|nr:uncharacterized protein MELLADRAFT_104415 [Melampsora larici-populina 98AG31]EGG09120.1 hypothetical protein MELLADRAFT_104415 [Melampsora larici-populina 98AG31]